MSCCEIPDYLRYARKGQAVSLSGERKIRFFLNKQAAGILQHLSIVLSSIVSLSITVTAFE